MVTATKEKEVSAHIQGQKLYLGKYGLDRSGYPYVPLEHLKPRDWGQFRPIDIVDGRVVVRRA